MSRFIFYIVSIFGFNSVKSQNHEIFRFVGQQYYTETKNFNSSTKTLTHILKFDMPSRWDEEDYYYLSITILDSSAALCKNFIDIKNDTSIAKVRFWYQSNWSWFMNQKLDINGKLFIRSWSVNDLTVSLDITVCDEYCNQMYIYQGDKVFESLKTQENEQDRRENKGTRVDLSLR